MCGLWLMGEGWTHSSAGEGGGEDRDGGAGEFGKNGAAKQGRVPGALILGNCRAKCGIWAFSAGCVIPSCPGRWKGTGRRWRLLP